MDFRAKITYTIDKNHPDYNCYPIDKRDEIFEYSDMYIMDEDFFNGYEEMIKYIIDDLLSIVGGEHNSDHVHHVNFEIEEV
jgi:hypothetical protein